MKLSGLPYLLKEGFKNIWTNRMMSLASVIVLISCLIITGTAALISVNVRTLIANIGDDNEITVYLQPDFSDTDSIRLGTELSALSNVENCRFRSREDVLKSYQDTLGENIYTSMQGEGNPFGNEYKLRLRDLSQYEDTVQQIKTLSGIDKVSDRSDIADKLTRLNYFVTIVGVWVVLILGVVTLFIIANTIKMTMYARRFEISIMKSVGATNAFVRIPFMVEAMAIGLFAGLLSSAVLIALYEPIRHAAAGVIGMIRTATLPVDAVWFPTLLAMTGAGLLIGLLGGSVSITRYLHKEGGAILGT
ncbi:MAG: permease-like cell division protein FtsX [Acutalibacteraceae bacterium]|nr:permease-like cell division protein FtsX [Acutalibacteraceae bacterium]